MTLKLRRLRIQKTQNMSAKTFLEQWAGEEVRCEGMSRCSECLMQAAQCNTVITYGLTQTQVLNRKERKMYKRKEQDCYTIQD